jgi:hypothetical protein
MKKQDTPKCRQCNEALTPVNIVNDEDLCDTCQAINFNDEVYAERRLGAQ